MALAFRRRVCRHLFGLNKPPTQQFDVLTAEGRPGLSTGLPGATQTCCIYQVSRRTLRLRTGVHSRLSVHPWENMDLVRSFVPSACPSTPLPSIPSTSTNNVMSSWGRVWRVCRPGLFASAYIDLSHSEVLLPHSLINMFKELSR